MSTIFNFFPLYVEDIDYLILGGLDDKTLLSMFLVSKWTNKLVSVPFFWRKRIENKLGFDIGITSASDSLLSPKDLYYKFSAQNGKKSPQLTAIECCCIPAMKHYFYDGYDYYYYYDEFYKEVAQSLMSAVKNGKISVLVTLFNFLEEDYIKEDIIDCLCDIFEQDATKLSFFVKNNYLFNEDDKILIFCGVLTNLFDKLPQKELYEIWIQQPDLFREWVPYATEIKLCGFDKFLLYLSDDQISSLINGNQVILYGLLEVLKSSDCIKRLLNYIPLDERVKYS